MSFTANPSGSGVAGYAHNTNTMSLTTTLPGDVIICIVTEHGQYGGSTNASECTGISSGSGNVTWSALSAYYREVNSFLSGNGTDSAWTGKIFAGVVNTAGTETDTFNWAGTYTGYNNVVAKEFTSSSGGVYLDAATFLNNPSGTGTWPTLTPAGSGEMYIGFAWNQGSASAGSTSGYTYNANADTASNGLAFNAAVTSGVATGPVWGDSSQTYGLMAVLSTISTAATAGTQQYPGMTSRPSVTTWVAGRPRAAHSR